MTEPLSCSVNSPRPGRVGPHPRLIGGSTIAAIVTEEGLEDRIVAFVDAGSIEVTPHDEMRLPELATHLRAGTTVYIAHPPRWLLQDVVRMAIKVRKRGWEARPHIVARALQSERALRAALGELNAAGIDQMLLIAGDATAPVGPFASTLEVLATGATTDCGFTTVAVAGHPEGHKLIGPTLLWDALRAKQTFADATGTHVPLVTQFGFRPQAVLEWHRHCLERGITLPVHVGLAGPTPLPRLIRFAMQCGIGTSLHALARSTSALAGLVRVTSAPDEMLIGLVRGQEATTATAIVKPHFYCFGGSIETARWLKSVRERSFALNDDGTRFTMT